MSILLISMNRVVNRNEKNINPCTVLVAATLLVLCSVTLISRIQKLNTDQEWDILIFVQRWPNTACMEWEEKSPPHNCSLPLKPGHWTIHGIWPTKLGTKGPIFCNSSQHFNASLLDDMKDELNEYWTDIQAGGLSNKKKEGLWKHEWLKHGTCAAVLETLNSEEKYFKQALTWLHDYNMVQTLLFEHVHPTKTAQGYEAEIIAKAVNEAIGKNPYIECIHDTKTGLPFLSEIRLCFDKNLVLIDCDGIKVSKRRNSGLWSSDKVLTNCPAGKPILYPSVVPPKTRRLTPAKPDHSVLNLYKVIMFFKWFTL